MKLRITSIAILLLFTIIGSAQNTIRGKVVSANQQGIENVTVQLIYNDSCLLKGTVTSQKGDFQIETNEQKRQLFLNFSAVGFVEQTIALQGYMGKETNVGIITLDSASVMLDEVTVTTQRYVRKTDKVIIFPNQKQAKYATNGYDLLSNLMIPGLNVNRIDKKVSTLSGEATLYINGTKASYQEVQALRAKDIARIEYHDTPQGRFAKDIVAVNYITKKYEYGGYIMGSAEQRVGYLLGDYMITTKYNKKRSTYSIIAGCEIERDNPRSFLDERISLSDNEINRNSDNFTRNPSNMQYVAVSMDKWTKEDNWNVQLGYVRSGLPNQTSDNKINYKELGKTMSSYNHIEQTSNKPYASLSYYHPINENKWLMIQTSAAYTKSRYKRNYEEENPFTENDYNYHTQTDEDYYRLIGDITYYWGLKHNNYFMADLTHFQNITSDKYTGDIQSNQNLSSGESQLRLTYAQTFGKKLFLQFTLGASLNMYSLRNEMSQTKFSPRPNIQLQYTFNEKHNVSFSGNMGNSSPQLAALSNIDQRIDIIQIRRGNPDLGITKFVGSDLKYTFLSNNFSLAASINYNGMLNLTKALYYEENSLLVQDFISDGEYHSIEYQLSPSLSLFNNSLRIKADMGFARSVVTGKYAITKSALKGSIGASYSFKDFFIQAYYSSPRNGIINQPCFYKLPANYGLSVGYYKGGWAMETGTSNPFAHSAKREMWAAIDIYAYTQQTIDKSYKAMAYIKVSYNFDFGRKVKKSNIDVKKEIDSAIFK